MPPILATGLLALHVAGGTVALLSGLVAMLLDKNKKKHRQVGLVFFWAMNMVAASAVGLAFAKSNLFLLAIGVFSFYMNFTGYRAIKNKSMKYAPIDWLVTLLAFGTAVFMLSTGNKILLVFGSILLFLNYRNTKLQWVSDEERKAKRPWRYLAHLGNMSGTYLSAATAFVVVNIDFVKPVWLVWLIPTLIGVPLIVYYTRVWKKKLHIP
ncbi:MAG: DUF2306 domain-containing protein [Bacteroidetes bacterium]|nr:DUF2306 domain-containing protein [Bacteroidota bacterium]